MENDIIDIACVMLLLNKMYLGDYTSVDTTDIVDMLKRGALHKCRQNEYVEGVIVNVDKMRHKYKSLYCGDNMLSCGDVSIDNLFNDIIRFDDIVDAMEQYTSYDNDLLFCNYRRKCFEVYTKMKHRKNDLLLGIIPNELHIIHGITYPYYDVGGYGVPVDMLDYMTVPVFTKDEFNIESYNIKIDVLLMLVNYYLDDEFVVLPQHITTIEKACEISKKNKGEYKI